MVSGQRGSILAGVIGITTLLSLAAAGLLLVAANSRNEEEMAFKRVGCYYDAESGLMMGVGWLRKKGSVFITGYRGWNGDSVVFVLPQPLENGSSVVVVIKDLAATAIPPAPTKTVVSRATAGSETIRLSWDIGVDPANTDPANPLLTLNKWRYQ